MNIKITGGSQNCLIDLSEREEKGVTYVDLLARFDRPTVPERLRLSFSEAVLTGFSAFTENTKIPTDCLKICHRGISLSGAPPTRGQKT